MSSETSMVAASVRLQEWAAQIKECQSRPSGMSVASWCADNGITKANYYYRLRQVRKACLEHIQKEIPTQQIVPVVSVSFLFSIFIDTVHPLIETVKANASALASILTFLLFISQILRCLLMYLSYHIFIIFADFIPK